MYPMKWINWILAVTILALWLNVPSGSAQQANTKPAATDAQETNIRAYVERLRADAKTKKTAILTELMQLNDDQADELAKLALELENKRTDLKRKYYEKFREQLGGIIAARFLQVENQMLMVIDLQIASSLPIVEK